MTELGTALRELAGEGVAPHPVEPEDLWRRGRTRVWRNRSISVAVAAAAAVMVLVSTSSIPEPHTAMPAGHVHAPAIPENVYQPNRFLARISDTGPPGQLAAIARGGHGWFGISATTGRYTALDLPGLATDAPVALSPDGARIAYGLTGPTRKKEFGPADGVNDGGPLPPHPMVGFAVYDLRSGKVVKQVWHTDYGLDPNFNENPLSWLGVGRLKFGYFIAVGSNMGKSAGAFVWNIDRGTTQRLAGDQLEDARYMPTTDPAHFVRMNVTDVVLTDDQGTPNGGRIRIKGWEGGSSSISLSRHFVVLTGPYGPGNPQRVSAAPRPSGASFSTVVTPVGVLIAPYFLGWRSEDSVLVTARKGELTDGFLRFSDPGSKANETHFYEVDLATRKARDLGRVDPGIEGRTVQVARNLLAAPMVDGLKPPSVVAALKVPLGIGGGLVLVGALGGLALIRRRRRG